MVAKSSEFTRGRTKRTKAEKLESKSKPQGVFVVVNPEDRRALRMRRRQLPPRTGDQPNNAKRTAPTPSRPPGRTQGSNKPEQKFSWRYLFAKFSGFFGFALAVAALSLGWMGRDTRRIFAEEGLGYALGVIGCLLLLTLLIFPLRKRLRFLKFLGPAKNLFKTHMLLGVIAPITILYHCNFQLGSLNSTVALFSMLLVASSGLVGRFFYTKIHHGLYGRKKKLKELLDQVRLTIADPGEVAKLVPDLMDQIAEYDQQVLEPPANIWSCLILPIRVIIRTRLAYFRLTAHSRRRLKQQAKTSATVAKHRRRMYRACKKYVAEHLRRVRRVAEFCAYDRLFALWHKVHLPFFLLLFVTAIIHVVAVHWYSL